MINEKNKKEDIAISVKNISKTFRIPHEKMSSLRGTAVNLFRSGGYEEFKALDDVSFEVKKGEFFGIIGRNGSGKSTLLKILASIYQPDKGKIKIDGMISPFLELGIGFNPELSGRDNVYLNATVLGMTKKQIDEKFNSIVQFSELERFIDQKLKNYSSGMQVRLAFSVSIHANREILLMDEVLAVGDSNFQSKCLTEFNKYKEMGRTVVLVTHDTATVERYCDRAMLLRNGKIKKIGKASEVANEYVYDNMSDEEKRILEEERGKSLQLRKELEDMKSSSSKDGGLRIEKEEKIQEEKKKQEGERKNKVAEITGVKFLDKDGGEKNVFETEEGMLIRIYFKCNKEVAELNFGIGFRSFSGDLVFGYNTLVDEFKLNHKNKYLTLSFEKLPILKGEYYINISCFGSNENNIFDYKPKFKTINFFSEGVISNYKGYCYIPHKWL